MANCVKIITLIAPSFGKCPFTLAHEDIGQRYRSHVKVLAANFHGNFESTASAFDSASGSILSSEAIIVNAKHEHCQIQRRAKLAGTESGVYRLKP